MVFPLVVGKEFAPLEDAVIEKVAVYREPELAAALTFTAPPTHSVEGEVAQEMAAQYQRSSDPVSS